MPRSIKTPLKPTKFEDLDPRTQDFIREKGLKKKSGGKKEGIGPLGRAKKKSEIITKDDKNILIINPDMFKKGDFKIIGEPGTPRMAKGGRAGFKAGSKGCKLAKRGRGRAYGKNS